MRRAVQALSLAEERELARLIALGRNPIWARQFIAEDRFRSRSRIRDGRGGNPSGSEGLYSSHVNSVIHVPDTDRTRIPDAEKFAPLSEEGLRRDD